MEQNSLKHQNNKRTNERTKEIRYQHHHHHHHSHPHGRRRQKIRDMKVKVAAPAFASVRLGPLSKSCWDLVSAKCSGCAISDSMPTLGRQQPKSASSADWYDIQARGSGSEGWRIAVVHILHFISVRLSRARRARTRDAALSWLFNNSSWLWAEEQRIRRLR